MNVGDIIRHIGYDSEEIKQLYTIPWYFLPYIEKSRIRLADFGVEKDGWRHPAEIEQWYLSLVRAGLTPKLAPVSQEIGTGKPNVGLQDLHVALVVLWDTLVQYPDLAARHRALESVLEMLTALHYRSPPFGDSLAQHLRGSVHFRFSLCEYILTLRGNYHSDLGNDRLPPTDECPEGSQAKKDRDARFDKLKNTLFRVARALLTNQPSEVFDFARNCPNFFFVDELEFYYGGAGRICADIRMTRMALSLEEANRIAVDYMREKTPRIDYREIFRSLDDNCFGQKSLLPPDRDVEAILPDPYVWMGREKFNALLQAQDLTLDDFKKAFSELSSANEWLRPFLRISNAKSHDFEAYNQLRFDPDTGCSWRLHEPHA